MKNTELSGSNKQHAHTKISLRQPLRCGFSILLCSCLFFGASHCRAQEQDAAEAARQERARKKQPKPQKHVYTEDDLGRAKILTPEDEARFAAQRQQSSPATDPAQAVLDANVDFLGETPQLPLGDIARRYRNAKLAMQGPTPFHLPFDEPVFAAPVISFAKPPAPRPNFSPTHPNLLPARPDVVVAPAMPSPAPLHRVDPFTRRSAPAVPTITRMAPAAHASVSLPAPAPAVPQVSQPGKVVAPRVGLPKFAPVPAAPLVQPSIPRVAPAPAIPQPKVSAKIATPKLESPRFAPAPAAPLAVAPQIAQPPAVVNPSSILQTITVQPGDSLWKLAKAALGRGSRWRELLAANPSIMDPAHLGSGMRILVPQHSVWKSITSDAKISVQKGDTLTKIAQSKYGRAAAWNCVAEANPEIVDPNRIYEGQQLLLPFRCKP